MRVLVTGVAGRVGGPVARGLAEAGHEVTTTDIHRPDGLELPFEPADLTAEGAADGLMPGHEVLVHLGNISSDCGVEDTVGLCTTNVQNNLRTFNAAQRAGVRAIVFASTIQVTAGCRAGFDDPRPCPLPYLPADGGLPINPVGPYGLSKAASEQMLEYMVRRDPALSAIAVRFPAVRSDDRYWRGRANADPDADEARSTGSRKKRGFPAYSIDELFSFLLLGDAVALVAAAVARRPAGYHTLFPADPRPTSARPVRELIERYYADVPLRRPIDQIEALIDNAPITELLGWRLAARPDQAVSP